MKKNRKRKQGIILGTLIALLAPAVLQAEVSIPSIIGNNMVLQREQENRIWGWANAGEVVTVRIQDQKKQAKTHADGSWRLMLDPLPVGGPYTMTIRGKNTLTLDNILVGEVWICSGQSNMQWSVNSSNDADLEKLNANHPRIRLISVPQVGTQVPQQDFEGQWTECSGATVGDFSAVGYFFGRQLQTTLQVPVGLIDNAWGGSAAEAWVRRDLLTTDPRYASLMKRWDQTEKEAKLLTAIADYEQALTTWQTDLAEARLAGKKLPPRPHRPNNQLTGNHRPSNIYNGVLYPTIGYGIRGVIWYQGESNAGRAYQYRHLFPLMIQNWRDVWDQGDFPFYWVQLADFRLEKPQPSESDWAELREAQTMTMEALPNTGEAVILNLGEAQDIHPKNKEDVGKRLARWALANEYGFDIVYRSPTYQSMERIGERIKLHFKHVGSGLDLFDIQKPVGFTIAGADQKFLRAEAKISNGAEIEVWSESVPHPVAVRYAWADNPVCNVQNKEGLPLTPFRTDDWPGITINQD
ncbi:MAG: sialate O-acetylesterase [Verrucomicrobiota bacterium]|nr:sialate O-acetylesterase [Verrucomicrobiota bacterium]